MIMEEGIIIFETKVDKFSKRFIKEYYSSLLIFAVFLLMAVFSIKKDNWGFMILVLIIGTIMLIVQYFYSHKHAYIKIQKVTLKDGWFYFEIIKGDEVKKLVIAKNSVGTILQLEGRGQNTAHLTILNGTEKVVEVYAANSHFRPQQLDEIAYKINVQAKT